MTQDEFMASYKTTSTKTCPYKLIVDCSASPHLLYLRQDCRAINRTISRPAVKCFQSSISSSDEELERSLVHRELFFRLSSSALGF